MPGRAARQAPSAANAVVGRPRRTRGFSGALCSWCSTGSPGTVPQRAAPRAGAGRARRRPALACAGRAQRPRALAAPSPPRRPATWVVVLVAAVVAPPPPPTSLRLKRSATASASSWRMRARPAPPRRAGACVRIGLLSRGEPAPGSSAPDVPSDVAAHPPRERRSASTWTSAPPAHELLRGELPRERRVALLLALAREALFAALLELQPVRDRAPRRARASFAATRFAPRALASSSSCSCGEAPPTLRAARLARRLRAAGSAGARLRAATPATEPKLLEKVDATLAAARPSSIVRPHGCARNSGQRPLPPPRAERPARHLPPIFSHTQRDVRPLRPRDARGAHASAHVGALGRNRRSRRALCRGRRRYPQSAAGRSRRSTPVAPEQLVLAPLPVYQPRPPRLKSSARLLDAGAELARWPAAPARRRAGADAAEGAAVPGADSSPAGAASTRRCRAWCRPACRRRPRFRSRLSITDSAKKRRGGQARCWRCSARRRSSAVLGEQITTLLHLGACARSALRRAAAASSATLPAR